MSLRNERDSFPPPPPPASTSSSFLLSRPPAALHLRGNNVQVVFHNRHGSWCILGNHVSPYFFMMNSSYLYYFSEPGWIVHHGLQLLTTSGSSNGAGEGSGDGDGQQQRRGRGRGRRRRRLISVQQEDNLQLLPPPPAEEADAASVLEALRSELVATHKEEIDALKADIQRLNDANATLARMAEETEMALAIARGGGNVHEQSEEESDVVHSNKRRRRCSKDCCCTKMDAFVAALQDQLRKAKYDLEKQSKEATTLRIELESKLVKAERDLAKCMEELTVARQRLTEARKPRMLEKSKLDPEGRTERFASSSRKQHSSPEDRSSSNESTMSMPSELGRRSYCAKRPTNFLPYSSNSNRRRKKRSRSSSPTTTERMEMNNSIYATQTKFFHEQYLHWKEQHGKVEIREKKLEEEVTNLTSILLQREDKHYSLPGVYAPVTTTDGDVSSLRKGEGSVETNKVGTKASGPSLHKQESSSVEPNKVRTKNEGSKEGPAAGDELLRAMKREKDRVKDRLASCQESRRAPRQSEETKVVDVLVKNLTAMTERWQKEKTLREERLAGLEHAQTELKRVQQLYVTVTKERDKLTRKLQVKEYELDEIRRELRAAKKECVTLKKTQQSSHPSSLETKRSPPRRCPSTRNNRTRTESSSVSPKQTTTTMRKRIIQTPPPPPNPPPPSIRCENNDDDNNNDENCSQNSSSVVSARSAVSSSSRSELALTRHKERIRNGS